MADGNGRVVIDLSTAPAGDARVAGATPLLEWIGDGATVFSP